jgi:hypothetical protein
MQATARMASVVSSTLLTRRRLIRDVKRIPHAPMKPRIMYIEQKAGSLTGSARIGRVTFNRTGRTIFYRDQIFRRIVGGGFKSNYIEEATGDDYWISGPKQDGSDRLYGERVPIEIDEDVREEYWTTIRNLPDERVTKCA